MRRGLRARAAGSVFPRGRVFITLMQGFDCHARHFVPAPFLGDGTPRPLKPLGGRTSTPIFFRGDSLPSPLTPLLVFFMVLLPLSAWFAIMLGWGSSVLLFWYLRWFLSVCFSKVVRI